MSLQEHTVAAAAAKEACTPTGSWGGRARSVASGPERSRRTSPSASARRCGARTARSGAVGRYYVAIHPERVRGFAEIIANPWVTAVSEAVLGPDYEIIELGFDVPLPGAFDQPWHRDFPAPRETLEERRLTSLAFNMTTVDVAEDMGPFEIAPGTQWETGADFEHGMFPPRSEAARYAQLAERKFPRMGDASARSGLTIHRGTAHHA